MKILCGSGRGSVQSKKSMRAITCDSCPFFVRHRKLLTAKCAKKDREGRKEDFGAAVLCVLGGFSLRPWRLKDCFGIRCRVGCKTRKEGTKRNPGAHAGILEIPPTPCYSRMDDGTPARRACSCSSSSCFLASSSFFCLSDIWSLNWASSLSHATALRRRLPASA